MKWKTRLNGFTRSSSAPDRMADYIKAASGFRKSREC
jgi:hypothetical protein